MEGNEFRRIGSLEIVACVRHWLSGSLYPRRLPKERGERSPLIATREENVYEAVARGVNFLAGDGSKRLRWRRKPQHRFVGRGCRLKFRRRLWKSGHGS